MMALDLNELQALAEEVAAFETVRPGDTAALAEWASRREAILARFSQNSIVVPAAEQAKVMQLVNAIVAADKKIIATLEAQLRDMEQQLAATNRMRQLLGSYPAAGSASTLRRVA